MVTVIVCCIFCALQACLECLEQLLGLADNQQQAAEAKVIPLLLDLVGPLPQHIVELEAPVKYSRTFTFSPPSRMSHNGRGAVPQLHQYTVRLFYHHGLHCSLINSNDCSAANLS